MVGRTLLRFMALSVALGTLAGCGTLQDFLVADEQTREMKRLTEDSRPRTEPELMEAVERHTKELSVREDAFSYYLRGNAYEKLGDYPKAVADYSNALQMQPKRAKWYAERAAIYQQLGQYKLALKDYDQALALDRDYEFLQGRAEVYEDMKDWNKALESVNLAIGLLVQDDGNLFLQRGQIYSELGKNDLAITDFTTASKINFYRQAEAFRQRGKIYEKEGDKHKAATDYVSFARQENTSTAYEEAADALANIGMTQQARRMYMLALDAAGTESERDYAQLVKLAQGAELPDKVKQYSDQGFAAINKVLEKDPDNIEKLEELSDLHKALKHDKEKRETDGILLFARNKVFVENAQDYHDRGILEMEMGLYEEAYADFLAAQKLKNDPDIRTHIAEAKGKMPH